MRASVTHPCFYQAARTRHFSFPAICFFSLLLAALTAFSQTPLKRNVFIINEVGLANPAVALVTQQLMSQLASSAVYQTEFYVESLDSTSLGDEASLRNIERLLVQEYQDRKLDVIVTMGPSSIKQCGFSALCAEAGLDLAGIRACSEAEVALRQFADSG